MDGVQTLRGIKYSPIPDRIEAGTFIVAAAVAGGDVTVKNIIPPHISPVMAKLAEAGVTVCVSDNSARIISDGSLKPISIKSMPFPGFPTDMQAQMCALACYADGTSVISEAVFENRFNHCNELMRMGARIKLEDRTAIIQGRALTPACVTACDLRAGAALIIAALRAKGETRIANIEYIDRGYESIDRKLRLLGAEIMRIY
jgi:UDP-N-acetylglucosamine 1-carboxyvinyltransferase